MRDSFVFYRSFLESIEDLPPNEFKECVLSLARYALDDKEPALVGVVKTFFKLVKPQIDANNKRFENGCKGGRPKTKPKPNENQTETKVKPNVNVNVNVNDNVYKKTPKIKNFNGLMSSNYNFEELTEEIRAK